MQKIYFIPGLAADKRLFSLIKLQYALPVVIEYIKPLSREPIEEYAFRLSKFITDPDPVIAGVSFGGIMAHEISLHIKTKKVILISTIKNLKEKPLRYKFIEYSLLQNIISASAIKHMKPAAHLFFGTRTLAESQLLDSLIDDADSEILEWSVNEFLKWSRTTVPENYTHIHGSDDRVFPITKITADYIINGGNHLMIYSEAKKISEIIDGILKDKTG